MERYWQILKIVNVSIPNRDFGQLQLAQGKIGVDLLKAFQSLIGILGNCNLSGHIKRMPAVMFQSLIGILGNCNALSY